MGTFSCKVRLADLDESRSVEIDALVDTGAVYTFAPAQVLEDLGVAATRRDLFELADGRIAEYDVGEARATIDGETVTTLVVFADDHAAPLLGAYALEGLRLAVDPFGQRLVRREKLRL